MLYYYLCLPMQNCRMLDAWSKDKNKHKAENVNEVNQMEMRMLVNT